MGTIGLPETQEAIALLRALQPAMTFVEDEQWVVAYFGQNEVRKIEPGNEAEIASQMRRPGG